MGKTLRLGFVMGGGVSLGTFSGAALSEAIKQQIVYGQYDTEEKDSDGNKIYAPYDKVEIDVFSGASAGAISLAIMLRILVNPRDKYRFLGFRSYDNLRDHLEQKLSRQFGGKLIEIKMEFPEKYEQLLAAQTIQEFQDKVWAKKVDVDRFLGTGSFEKNMRDYPGFMDRGIVDQLGTDIFQFQTPASRLKHKILLGDRVLFGCTLANLSHTLKKSKRTHLEDGHKPSLIKALNDSSVDRIHSELRVFDLNFNEINSSEGAYYPLRWVQFHDGDDMVIIQEDQHGSEYNKIIENLNGNNAWREITATAIASAAVPFAFEPVVLNRYRFEYGSEWAEELKGKESYPFTYVDGGVFNNEPVKEAFRLASYIDTTKEDKDFERQLIFVDPDVTELENQFKIHAHEKLSIGRSFFSSKTKVTTKPTILRLLSGITHILSAILNEAQSVEVGKISKLLDKFELREQMRLFYRETIKSIPSDDHISLMIDFAKKELDVMREKLCLPKKSLQIQHELIRIANEERAYLKPLLPLSNEKKLLKQALKFVADKNPSKSENAVLWLYILSCLTLDISMDMVGKTSHTKLIPIAPFNFYDKNEEFKLMALPGKGMAGFTGFASHEASIYEVEHGKFCSMRILQELQLTEQNEQNLPCPPPFDYSQYDDFLKNNLRASIVKRIKEMLPSGFSTIMPFLDGYLNESIYNFVESNIDGNAKASYFEFRIRVPNDTYLLRGFSPDGTVNSKRSVYPVSIHGEFFLITKIAFDFEDDQWKGAHTNFMQNLYIDKAKLFDDIPSISLELPVMSYHSEAYLSPNPLFTTDARAGLNIPGYTEINSKCWDLISDIKPLDEHLWGRDKWLEED